MNVRASSIIGWSFVYFTAYYCIEDTIFKPMMYVSKWKSSSDVAGTAKKGQAITMETKVKIMERGSKVKGGRCHLFL